mgnify:FL=1
MMNLELGLAVSQHNEVTQCQSVKNLNIKTYLKYKTAFKLGR